MKKIVINFIYQSAFQVIKLLAPLITIPLVSHSLGAENIGIYNYLYSIVSYFVLFSGLGIQLYGQRMIARYRENRDDLSIMFWKLVKLQIFFSSIMIILFFLIASKLSNSEYLYVMSLMIFSVLIDVSWLFMGVEEFKMTSIRSIAITILTMIFIILFVNDKGDLLKYIYIQSIGMFVSQLIMWPFIFKYVNFKKVKFMESLHMFRDIVIYFLPQIGNIIMGSMITTLLGVWGSKTDVGYYSNGFLVVTIINTIVSTIDTVLLPRMSFIFVEKGRNALVEVMEISIKIQLYFTIPACFGLILISNTFVSWFFGPTFLEVEKILPLLSPLAILIPLNSSLSRQYLLPIGNMKEYNISVFTGALVSTVLCFTLLKPFGVYGAVIASLLGQLTVFFTRYIPFKKNTTFNIPNKEIILFVFSGFSMLVVGQLITVEHFQGTIIQIILGVLVYGIITTLTKVNPIINFLVARRTNYAKKI